MLTLSLQITVPSLTGCRCTWRCMPCGLMGSAVRPGMSLLMEGLHVVITDIFQGPPDCMQPMKGGREWVSEWVSNVEMIPAVTIKPLYVWNYMQRSWLCGAIQTERLCMFDCVCVCSLDSPKLEMCPRHQRLFHLLSLKLQQSYFSFCLSRGAFQKIK